MPQLDVATYLSQLFWLVVTFAFLYVLGKTVILPKIGGALENRHRRIADDLEAAERLRRQAQDALEAHDRLLSESRAEAQRLVRTEKEKVLAEVTERRKALEAELAAKIAEAEKALSRSRQQALAELEGAVSELAGEIIGKVSGGAVPEKALKAALAQRRKEG